MPDFDNYDEEENELPNFSCRLPIPDEIVGGDRMLLQQVDILRQEIAYVYKKQHLGRRAFHMVKALEAKVEKFQRLYWMILGGASLVGLYLKFTH